MHFKFIQIEKLLKYSKIFFIDLLVADDNLKNTYILNVGLFENQICISYSFHAGSSFFGVQKMNDRQLILKKQFLEGRWMDAGELSFCRISIIVFK